MSLIALKKVYEPDGFELEKVYEPESLEKVCEPDTKKSMGLIRALKKSMRLIKKSMSLEYLRRGGRVGHARSLL